MGGVQSGTHNLGEALWVHERQRQKCHREGNRCEGQAGQSSTQDRRKLLKRTRSLAVISEDESRQDRESRHFRFSESTYDLPRRHQLIPRAKLIDRNSLKDRLSKSQQHLSDSYERFSEAKSCYSRSTCGLHSIPLTSLPDPLPYSRGNRSDPDRLNILDWPKPPRRYRSVQALDTVSGLVDIVEDNWPIEGNRSIDCIYTQVKRKRKEHRSLDSILFEDDGELEYFDVLNLLPLSNVRLEFNENDAKSDSLKRRLPGDNYQDSCRPEIFEYNSQIEDSNSSNVTDEEKCKVHATKEEKELESDEEQSEESLQDLNRCRKDHYQDLQAEDTSSDRSSDKSEDRLSKESFGIEKNHEGHHEGHRKEDKTDRKEISNRNRDNRSNRSDRSSLNDRYEPDVPRLTSSDIDHKIEEAEDFKSIWISDCEEQEDMSRRPQVLKIIDSDVTKRRHRRSIAGIDSGPNDSQKNFNDEEKESTKENQDSDKRTTKKCNEIDDVGSKGTDSDSLDQPKDKPNMEIVRNLTERKTSEKEAPRTKQNEGRFERIVKETSNILGKACSAVKGSLGFEARSESSDLGLGSESGSESRRRSMDDEGVEEDQSSRSTEKNTESISNDPKKNHSNLTRSKSCVDSIDCQEDGAEFDHVRYKIVKSNVFSKTMFNSARRNVTYEGLMQYLREYSFQELLLDNNVVIIEPVRAEPVERKSPDSKRSDSSKVPGTSQKKMDLERNDKNGEKSESGSFKSPKQSSIRKHFFYHPIRVNRELIDEELPDPDTVRNVRRMFENTLKTKDNSAGESSQDSKSRKSSSMKDLCSIDDDRYEETPEKPIEGSRSRCSSRAKDLTRLFESLEKSTSSNASVTGSKDEPGSPRSESKTRILAQSFEARSGHTSPSDSNSSKNKINRYHQHHHNWDSGSISSGVSSDYPDTDPGSGAHCTSSEDEDVDCHDDDGVDQRSPGHYVSQDVLKRIRECGTSVTYYGGKVVNTYNGPLISPLISKRSDRVNDYVKFRLVKSNSCDSRLELTGRLVENRGDSYKRESGKSNKRRTRQKEIDLRQCTIAETPSIEITTIEKQETEEEQRNDERISAEVKREPPVVIGLEPKKDDSKENKDKECKDHKDPRAFKADFKLGCLDDAKSNYPNRFSALNRWQINDSNWRNGDDFGKMEFEEFEVLEDSLNTTDNQRIDT